MASYSALELFNKYTDEFGGDHNAFTGWLGTEFGYGDADEFANDYGPYITKFDPQIGLNTAFQEYYNATGVDLTNTPYSAQAETFNGMYLTNSGLGPAYSVQGEIEINTTPGFEGDIKNEFITTSKNTTNEFERNVLSTQAQYGGKAEEGRAELGAASGVGNIMKSGGAQRKIVKDLSQGSKVGGTLTDALAISQEEALTSYTSDLEAANVGLNQGLNSQVQSWYNNVMQGIEALAQEDIFPET
jgi:hypothetical protein